MNEKLYLRNPEGTEVGKQIIKSGVDMISNLGYEQFTFKKLATEIGSTEATVYRYFENKHKLLIYLVDWYWAYVEFQVIFQLNNVVDPAEKIRKLIDILVWEDNATNIFSELDQQSLYYIAIAEGSKTYLSKDVDNHNKDFLFKPYKDLCGRIALLFKEYNPKYKYPSSLASTLVGSAHMQYYFMHHLPRLGDYSKKKSPKEIEAFLEQMVFGVLDAK
ncbi:MAG: TetR/AcrR family transcriptional regulator [Ferruginibacter sp.]|nr:TetR/AcrR family transcriptional regulator [Ferruginibacter sp.]